MQGNKYPENMPRRRNAFYVPRATSQASLNLPNNRPTSQFYNDSIGQSEASSMFAAATSSENTPCKRAVSPTEVDDIDMCNTETTTSPILIANVPLPDFNGHFGCFANCHQGCVHYPQSVVTIEEFSEVQRKLQDAEATDSLVGQNDEAVDLRKKRRSIGAKQRKGLDT